MTVAPMPPGSWLAGIAQLLDEHHLAVVADRPAAAADVASAAANHLSGMPQASVIAVSGAGAADGPTFAARVAERLDGAPICRTLPELAAALRTTPEGVRWRYLLWLDADEMLERDVILFGRIVNTLLSVAVDHEHVTTDPLLIQRVIFSGGAKLGAYAEEEAGQFRTWLPGTDAAVDRPKVLTYRVDG